MAIKEGDKIPNVKVKATDMTDITTDTLFSGKKVVLFAVPGAFTPTCSNKHLPGFIEKAARAGCTAVFIGLENINPASLAGAKKRQNKITEYRRMLLAWKKARVITYAGYILGFPNDTVESILHDIDVIKRELPVDLLEFFYLTPLPGSEESKSCHA